MSDESKKPSKQQACLAMGAGILFMIAAILLNQLAFIGVGTAWLAIGAVHLKKSK